MANTVQVNIIDVAGPMPDDNGGLVFLEAANKVFPQRCSLEDAIAIFYMLCKVAPGKYAADGPYDHFAALCKAVKLPLDSVLLVDVHGSLYSDVVFRGPRKKPLKICLDSPAPAMRIGQAFSAPTRMLSADIERIIDSREQYLQIRDYFGNLWPLPMLTDTTSLRIMSDFMDAAIPDGSIFSVPAKSN
jgi:hypothetical protein